jgi:hypothetical protein
MAFFNAIPVNKIPKFLEALKTSFMKKTKYKAMTGLNPSHANMPPISFPNTLKSPAIAEKPFLAFIVNYYGPDVNAKVGVVSKRLGLYAVGNFKNTNIFPITDKIEIIPIVVNDAASIGTGRLVRGDTNTVTPASIVAEDIFFHELGKCTLEDFIQIAAFDLASTELATSKIKETPKKKVFSCFGSCLD